MKSIGIVRKIDSLGRVVIPSEVRTTQGWDEKTPLEMYMEGDGLVLKKYEPGCFICGGDVSSSILINGKVVCLKCCEQIGRR